MSRKSKSQRSQDTGGRHIRLYHWIMDTAAWKSLSPVARSLYIEMAARYMGSNNGRIPYSQREAAEALRVGKTTALLAFNQLQDRGFTAGRIVQLEKAPLDRMAAD